MAGFGRLSSVGWKISSLTTFSVKRTDGATYEYPCNDNTVNKNIFITYDVYNMKNSTASNCVQYMQSQGSIGPATFLLKYNNLLHVSALSSLIIRTKKYTNTQLPLLTLNNQENTIIKTMYL